MFQQLTQVLCAGLVWLQAALLLGLLVTILFRPERIRSPGLFRAACVLFALSVFVGPVLTAGVVFLDALDSGGFRFASRPGDFTGTLVLLASATGPVLLGISSLLALISLCPAVKSAYHSQPPRHPLE